MIYFAQPVGGGNIKIGTTVRLSVRIAQLQTQYKTDLTVLGVMDGSYADEKPSMNDSLGSGAAGNGSSRTLS